MALRGSLKSGLAAYSVRLQYPLPEYKLLEGGAASPCGFTPVSQNMRPWYLAPRECLLSICCKLTNLAGKPLDFSRCITHYHRISSFKQHLFIISWFCRFDWVLCPGPHKAKIKVSLGLSPAVVSGGSSSCGARLLIRVASLVAGHGLQAAGAQQLWLMGSVVLACRLSSPRASGILLD